MVKLKQQPNLMRKIRINGPQEQEYPDNSIKTAKYNYITFLPLAIIYQFASYFNIFFLVTAVILSIPDISPLDPASALGPFLFVILISIVREGFEDHKKAKYDKTCNNSVSLQYDQESEEFSEVIWQDISIGKIVKVLRNELVPADLLIIKSSNESGFCYLQTTNLDGETALKPREAIYVFQEMIKEEKDLLSVGRGYMLIDPPDNNIYKAEGCLVLEALDEEKIYFNINNILLRGGTLKNVEYVYGLVIYTGKETKIMKNIKSGSLKLSSIEIQLNKIIIIVIIVAVLICLLCTLFGMLFWNSNKDNMDHIFYSNTTEDSDTFVREVFKTFAAFFTIFNTLIPISIMVIMEIIKGMQVLMLEKDPLLKQEKNEKVKILSMKLHEDLGNIRYIFTDKTGTLTKNEMEFKACSIFTKLFDQEKYSGQSDSESLTGSKTDSTDQLKKSIFALNFDTQLLRDSLLFDQPISMVNSMENPFKSMKDAVFEFFLNIAINHNVLTEYDNNLKQNVYTGSNPDEVVLVQAAKELGIEFLERNSKTVKIKIFDEEFIFEILHRFEYSSARMRSSIIVKDQYNVVKLYMKGADSIILKKINEFSQNFLFKETKDHLEKFAKTGLRTLCYSIKIIEEDKLKVWEGEYKQIQEAAMKKKELAGLLDETIALLEDDMLLIGVSGLEDKLQDEVKNVLHDFIEAGINVWMLTGDKLDTAESIGYSCRLFNDDTEVFKIKAGQDKSETLRNVTEILKKMETMEQELLDFKIEKKIKKKRGEKAYSKKKKKNKELNKISDLLILNKNKISDRPHTGKKTNSGDKDNIVRTLGSVINTVGSNNKNSVTSLNNKLLSNFKPQVKSIKHKQYINQRNRSPSGQVFDGEGNPLDLQEMNNQIKNENMKFIGSNLDEKSNLITLNFIRSNSIDQTQENRHKTEHIQIKKNRPISSQVGALKKRNLDFPRLEFKKESSILDSEDSVEVDDVDIIKYMIDKKFFEENLGGEKEVYNQNNFTFLNNILGSQGTIRGSVRKNTGDVSNEYYMKRDDKGLKINKPLKSTDRHLKVDDDFDYNNIDPDDYEGNESIQQRKFNRKILTKNLNLDKEIEAEESKIQHLGVKVDNSHAPNPKNRNKNRNEDSKESVKEETNFDFSNLYEHYKNKIQKLEPQHNYKLLNFNFGDREDENNEKDISMKNFGLIVEGSAITMCLDEEIAPVFWECLRKSRSIICCRCAPIQKSEVVSYVRFKSGEVTLAIGDGGNDVNMIKAANVGVGIFGKEGYQAAFNSDYAISQFKYLKRLLFVHGRFSLLRNSYFVNFFFYKNMMFTLPQFWFALFSGFSGALLWDDWYYLGFNSFMTTLPVGMRMLFEEDIDITFEGYPDRHIINELIPNLYRELRNMRPFNIPKFFFIFLGGIIHSVCVFFIPFYINENGISDQWGRTLTQWDQSLLSYFSLILIHYWVITEDTYYYNSLSTFSHIVQFIIYIMFLFIHEALYGDQLSGITFDSLSNLKFWLAMFLTVYISIIPFMVARRVESLFGDSIVNNLRHKKYEHDYAKKVYMKKLAEMKKYTRSLAKFKKIYNLNADFEPDNLADKKIKDIVDNYRNTRRNTAKTLKEKKTSEMMLNNLPQLKKKNTEVLPSYYKDREINTHNDDVYRQNSNENKYSNIEFASISNSINHKEENKILCGKAKSPDRDEITNNQENEKDLCEEVETKLVNRDHFASWHNSDTNLKKLKSKSPKHSPRKLSPIRIPNPALDSDLNQNVVILEEEKSNLDITDSIRNPSRNLIEDSHHQNKEEYSEEPPKTTPVVNFNNIHQNFFEIIEEESREHNNLEFTIQTVKHKDISSQDILETPAIKPNDLKPIIHEYPVEISNLSSSEV